LYFLNFKVLDFPNKKNFWQNKFKRQPSIKPSVGKVSRHTTSKWRCYKINLSFRRYNNVQMTPFFFFFFFSFFFLINLILSPNWLQWMVLLTVWTKLWQLACESSPHYAMSSGWIRWVRLSEWVHFLNPSATAPQAYCVGWVAFSSNF